MLKEAGRVKYWERINLQRARSQKQRRNNSIRSHDDGDRGPLSGEADEEHEINNSVKRKAGTYAEITIAAFTVVLAVASIFQWGSLNRQLNLADKQFESSQAEGNLSANEAAAALNVSESQAAAVANQAVAMKKMATAAEKQADAAGEQAKTSEKSAEINRQQLLAQQKQLSMQQSASLDLDIHVDPYTRDSGFTAHGIIANRGSYTIREAKLAVARDFLWGIPIAIFGRLCCRRP